MTSNVGKKSTEDSRRGKSPSLLLVLNFSLVLLCTRSTKVPPGGGALPLQFTCLNLRESDGLPKWGFTARAKMGPFPNHNSQQRLLTYLN
ncbi:hypothetical protein BO86DRAFT_117296 [Aspergillus japonicus CBS 114.51]|uniref:Uncharacterized protein n=1 Tax=Aspergillus japonicus CBS 114.51 TaxID=1448312 RepID=A0A8T8WYD9_ASPJA|nr:hypothetical protein BO86DRAFT_117296 [Aspergillus japonicus CBS 114.51]RAH80897.1 hypothetical protein BO86DRAFT_117296 [Aspergillus japonicus CBS 114.51]